MTHNIGYMIIVRLKYYGRVAACCDRMDQLPILYQLPSTALPAALTRRKGGERDTEIILEFCFAQLNDWASQSIFSSILLLLLRAKHILHNNSPCLREFSVISVLPSADMMLPTTIYQLPPTNSYTCPRLMMMARTATSAGFTPGMRDACASVSGRYFLSFSRLSKRTAVQAS